MQRKSERSADPLPQPPGEPKAAPSTPGLGRPLPLPHERDEAVDALSAAPLDPVIVQAKKDLDAGLVDTDLRNAPGADAQQRAKLLGREVPGPGSSAVSRAGEAAPSAPADPARRRHPSG